MNLQPYWRFSQDSMSRQWELRVGDKQGPRVWFNFRKKKYMAQVDYASKIRSFATLEEAQAVVTALWRLKP